MMPQREERSDVMTAPERLNKLISESQLSYERLGELSGVPKSSLQRYAAGITKKIPIDSIEKVAPFLGVSAAFIMGWEETDSAPDYFRFDNIIPIPKTKKVPFYGDIACGQPILAVADLDEFIDMPEHIKATFALRCKGDSMINARIFDGDIVYINGQNSVNNGEIAAVIINDEEVTLKRVYYYPDDGKMILEAANPTEADQKYYGEELNHIRIIGKAVAFLSTVK